MAEQSGGQLERWLSIGGSIVAPATAITALLFYFGYVSSRAQYDYFGVDVDLVGLTTRDYVMRSPQPLLVPLLVITLGCALLLGVHTWVRRRVTEPDRLRRLVRRTVAVGLVVLVVAVALLFLYPWLGDFVLYPLLTPLVLVAGGSLVGWGLLQLRRLDAQPDAAGAVRAAGWTPATWLRCWCGSRSPPRSSGRPPRSPTGRGVDSPRSRPASSAPCPASSSTPRSPCSCRRARASRRSRCEPVEEGQEFRYRYWHLRLLVEGKDVMFLVPNTWQAGNTTLLVPLDDSVRVQFQFRNDPP